MKLDCLKCSQRLTFLGGGDIGWCKYKMEYIDFRELQECDFKDHIDYEENNKDEAP